MKDEIKEILDKLKDDDWYDELDLTGDKWIELKQTETKQILDYITNLQQAIKDTKDTADDMLYELKQENERLKEEKSLIESDINNAYSWLEDYKSRCEKGIEYIMTELIDEWSIRNQGYVSGSDLSVDAITPILNILQNGSDN